MEITQLYFSIWNMNYMIHNFDEKVANILNFAFSKNGLSWIIHISERI